MAILDEFNNFKQILDVAREYDDQNQILRQSNSIDVNRLHSLTEAIFFKVYRSFENFVESVFILYSQEEPTSEGTQVVSYLKPIDSEHTKKLLNGSLQYLDWNSPDNVKERAEIYLENGFPVKDVMTTHRTALNTYKKLRNHYAHNSGFSLKKYKNIVKDHFGFLPPTIPRVGEYLLITTKNDSSRYYLQKFFDDLETISMELKR